MDTPYGVDYFETWLVENSAAGTVPLRIGELVDVANSLFSLDNPLTFDVIYGCLKLRSQIFGSEILKEVEDGKLLVRLNEREVADVLIALDAKLFKKKSYRATFRHLHQERNSEALPRPSVANPLETEVAFLRTEVAALRQALMQQSELLQGLTQHLQSKPQELSGNSMWRLAIATLNLSAPDPDLRMESVLRYLDVQNLGAELEAVEKYGLGEIFGI